MNKVFLSVFSVASLAAILMTSAVMVPALAERGETITICHQGKNGEKTIQVSQKQLERHLAHGDTLGPCVDIPPEPPTCQEECQLRAHQAFEQCIREGGSEAECKSLAEEILLDCLLQCEPNSCEEECKIRAIHAYDECVESGGSEEECQLVAQQVFRECSEQCVPPPTCEEECKISAFKLLEDCIAAGEPEEQCIALAEQHYLECITTCQG